MKRVARGRFIFPGRGCRNRTHDASFGEKHDTTSPSPHAFKDYQKMKNRSIGVAEDGGQEIVGRHVVVGEEDWTMRRYELIERGTGDDRMQVAAFG